MQLAVGSRSLLVLCLSLFAFACANRQDVVDTKVRGKGVARTYAVTVDQAWTIAKTVFLLEPTEEIEEHRAEGYMITAQDSGPLSSGTYLGAFLEPTGSTSTVVTFVARRRAPTQAYPALGAETFHRKFAALLGLVAEVGPLPIGADGGVAPIGPSVPIGPSGAATASAPIGPSGAATASVPIGPAGAADAGSDPPRADGGALRSAGSSAP